MRTKQKSLLRTLEGVKWIPIYTPIAWRPSPGQELTGYYGGSTTRHGSTGEYEVHIVHTETSSYYVSGVMICDLFHAAKLLEGDLVRVTFTGVRELKDGKNFKEFELRKGVPA